MIYKIFFGIVLILLISCEKTEKYNSVYNSVYNSENVIDYDSLMLANSYKEFMIKKFGKEVSYLEDRIDYFFKIPKDDLEIINRTYYNHFYCYSTEEKTFFYKIKGGSRFRGLHEMRNSFRNKISQSSGLLKTYFEEYSQDTFFYRGYLYPHLKDRRNEAFEQYINRLYNKKIIEKKYNELSIAFKNYNNDSKPKNLLPDVAFYNKTIEKKRNEKPFYPYEHEGDRRKIELYDRISSMESHRLDRIHALECDIAFSNLRVFELSDSVNYYKIESIFDYFY